MIVYVVLTFQREYGTGKIFDAEILGTFLKQEDADECKHENRRYYGDIEIKEATLS